MLTSFEITKGLLNQLSNEKAGLVSKTTDTNAIQF